MQKPERYSRKAARCAAFLVFLAAVPATAPAAVDISPVVVEMSAQRDKDVVRISNTGDTAKSFEVTVVAWSQSDTEREIYAPTDELLAVPPLFTLEPGAQQIVRIGLMREPDTENERAYRVFFTELAPPEVGEQAVSGVSMRLRFGIPVFVAPSADGVPALDFTGIETHDGQAFMQLRNIGNVRVKVTEVRYQSPLAEDAGVKPAVFYLHPGKSGALPLDFPNVNRGGTVQLVTDTAGVLDYALSGMQ